MHWGEGWGGPCWHSKGPCPGGRHPSLPGDLGSLQNRSPLQPPLQLQGGVGPPDPPRLSCPHLPACSDPSTPRNRSCRSQARGCAPLGHWTFSERCGCTPPCGDRTGRSARAVCPQGTRGWSGDHRAAAWTREAVSVSVWRGRWTGDKPVSSPSASGQEVGHGSPLTRQPQAGWQHHQRVLRMVWLERARGKGSWEGEGHLERGPASRVPAKSLGAPVAFHWCCCGWGGEERGGSSLVGHFPWERPGRGRTVPGVIDPAVNSYWQEGVEVEPDGEIILRFAVAHPVHNIWLVQLCFQLVPETPGHWGHQRESRASCRPHPTTHGFPQPLRAGLSGRGPAGAASLENSPLRRGAGPLGAETRGQQGGSTKNILRDASSCLSRGVTPELPPSAQPCRSPPA